jgi:hypothetical protein
MSSALSSSAGSADSMGMTVRIYLVALMLQAVSTAIAQQLQEPKLEPGPFRHVRGGMLGKPILFENEIETTTCHPIIISGRVIGWLARAYPFNGLLLVKRCFEYDPSEEQTAGSRHGGENELWEDVVLGRDGDLIATPLHLPHETTFANGSFCSAFIAYWGFSEDDQLIPVIFNLRSRSVTTSRSLGKVNLETDDSGFLPPPRWNVGCSSASFDATKASRSVVNLTAGRSSR